MHIFTLTIYLIKAILYNWQWKSVFGYIDRFIHHCYWFLFQILFSLSVFLNFSYTVWILYSFSLEICYKFWALYTVEDGNILWIFYVLSLDFSCSKPYTNYDNPILHFFSILYCYTLCLGSYYKAAVECNFRCNNGDIELH